MQFWCCRPTFYHLPEEHSRLVILQWLSLTTVIFSWSIFCLLQTTTSQRLYILQIFAARFAFVVRSPSRMEHIVVIMSSGSSPAAYRGRKRERHTIAWSEEKKKSHSGYYALFKSPFVLSVSNTHTHTLTSQNFYINKWTHTRTPCRNTYKSSKCTAHIHGQLMLI